MQQATATATGVYPAPTHATYIYAADKAETSFKFCLAALSVPRRLPFCATFTFRWLKMRYLPPTRLQRTLL